MRTRLPLLIALVITGILTPGRAADRADGVLLKEDFQVLQRDAADQASCTVGLPAALRNVSGLAIEVQDARDQRIRLIETSPVDLRGGERGAAIEKLPVGGPYTIAIRGSDKSIKDVVCFRHILVGDVWILGGQSNMYGIDVIKEDLPALPYLNMLNLMHIEKDSHWCAGAPPIHRIPDIFRSTR